MTQDELDGMAQAMVAELQFRHRIWYFWPREYGALLVVEWLLGFADEPT